MSWKSFDRAVGCLFVLGDSYEKLSDKNAVGTTAQAENVSSKHRCPKTGVLNALKRFKNYESGPISIFWVGGPLQGTGYARIFQRRMHDQSVDHPFPMR